MEPGNQEDNMALLLLLPRRGLQRHEMPSLTHHESDILHQNLKAHDSQSCSQSGADTPRGLSASASQLWENGRWHRGTYRQTDRKMAQSMKGSKPSRNHNVFGWFYLLTLKWLQVSPSRDPGWDWGRVLRPGPDELKAEPGRRRLGVTDSGCNVGAQGCNVARGAEAALWSLDFPLWTLAAGHAQSS